jgi:hypothetical protein
MTGSLAAFEQLSAKRIESFKQMSTDLADYLMKKVIACKTTHAHTKSRNDGCFCKSFIQFGFLKEAFNLRGASTPSEKWFLPKVGTSYSMT